MLLLDICGAESLYFRMRDTASKVIVSQKTGSVNAQVRVNITDAQAYLGEQVWVQPRKDSWASLVA